MQVKLITPEKTLFSAEATQVQAPGTLGEFGVFPGHMPFISTLKPGVITIETEAGQKLKVAVIGGIAEVVPEHCTILAESALDVTALSQGDAQAMVSDAKKALEDAGDEAARKTAQAQLDMAEAVALAA